MCNWTASGATDVGRVRASNEDAFAVEAAEGIFVVADGMGGHAAGEVASRLAVERIVAALKAAGGGDGSGERMSRALDEANRAIVEAAGDPERRGMGTTATVLHRRAGSSRYVIGHVGDSRAYRLRNGELRQLTRDQTWVQRQVDAGLLPAEQARGHPYSNVLVQALGLEGRVSPEVVDGTAEDGDLFLLCSDGLTAMLDDEEIQVVLSGGRNGDLDALCRELVERANERGGVDNVTVVVVRVEGDAGA